MNHTSDDLLKLNKVVDDPKLMEYIEICSLALSALVERNGGILTVGLDEMHAFLGGSIRFDHSQPGCITFIVARKPEVS